MGRPPALSARRKVEIVLAVLSGETTIASAATDIGVSGQAVGNWKRQFVDAGLRELEGRSTSVTEHEKRLRAEIVDLRQALGELYAQMRSIRAYTPSEPGSHRGRQREAVAIARHLRGEQLPVAGP